MWMDDQPGVPRSSVLCGTSTPATVSRNIHDLLLHIIPRVVFFPASTQQEDLRVGGKLVACLTLAGFSRLPIAFLEKPMDSPVLVDEHVR